MFKKKKKKHSLDPEASVRLPVLLHDRNSVLVLVSKQVQEELESRANVDGDKEVSSVRDHHQHGDVKSVEENFFPGLHEVAAGDELELAVQPVQIVLHALKIHLRL